MGKHRFEFSIPRIVERPQGFVGCDSRPPGDGAIWMDVAVVLGFPGGVVAGREGPRVIHLRGDEHLATGTDVESQAAVGLPAAGQNEHDRPGAAAEDAVERVLVGATWRWTIAGMGMQPQSGELFGLAPRIDLGIEEIGDSIVVKRNANCADPLLDGYEVFDRQQVVATADAEAADLGVTVVAEILELGPRGGVESQDRCIRPTRLPALR